MRRVLLLALAGAFAACKPSGPPGPAAGKAYFTQVGCASCHKVGAEGSAVGPDLTLTGFRHNKEWLDLFIKDPQGWKPSSLMPNRRLSPEARAAIVLYLLEQKGQAWAKGARPWDGTQDPVAKGRLIYLKAGCVACHGAGGAGGQPNNNVKGGLIPALNNASETYTKKELVEKIRRGVTPQKDDPKGPEPLIRMPAWGDYLNQAELEAVADYLLTLEPGTAPSVDW